MNLNNVIFTVLEEQNILKTTKTKPIVDAIKDRKKISFYYSGPKKPKKDSVKSGQRIDAEPVALGLSKRGNLIVRAFIQPPSVSKKGFENHGWRTFMVSRMGNMTVSDDTFDQKRPGYKEGDDNSMSVTYVTSDWTKQPKTKEVEKPEPKTEPTKQVEPSVTIPIDKNEIPKPEVEPKSTELPQPKSKVKPTEIPQDTDNKDYVNKQKELYKTKQTDWVSKQKEVGGNIKPGQGTRERFKKEVEKELPQPKPIEKPVVNPEEDEQNKNLQESIKNIKRLMFS